MAIFRDSSTGQTDRSSGDRKRHRELVEGAIKKNIGDIIAEESIIGQHKDKKIKIPIKGIKEYQFIYGKNTGGTGAGTGQEKRGQFIGKINGQHEQGGGQAGNEAGEEIYETEITVDELVNYLFDELELPDLERKKFSQIECEYKFKKSGYQRKGIPPRLAKKKTVIEKLKREQKTQQYKQAGDPYERFPFSEEDLRYRRVKKEVRQYSNAVVICIMDTSGSMDQSKKYLARTFYFLLYQFIRWKYEHVEVVFVAHTTEAKEVGERDFFHRGESGGTFISSGYEKALEIIEQRYNPSIWNIYVFHCSDGDNWIEDNEKAIGRARELCQFSNLFGYAEITASCGYSSNIRREYERNIQADNFIMVNVRKKEDIWPAFKKILEKESEQGGMLE